jgi:hypothetical protein
MNGAIDRAPSKPEIYDRMEMARKFLRGALAELSRELALRCNADRPDDQAARGLAGACEKIAGAMETIDVSSC